MYFSGKAELTVGEMRDAGKRGPEAGGGAKGSEGEVVGLVHIFFLRKKIRIVFIDGKNKDSGMGRNNKMVQLGLLYVHMEGSFAVTMGANFNFHNLFSAMYHDLFVEGTKR